MARDGEAGIGLGLDGCDVDAGLGDAGADNEGLWVVGADNEGIGVAGADNEGVTMMFWERGGG